MEATKKIVQNDKVWFVQYRLNVNTEGIDLLIWTTLPWYFYFSLRNSRFNFLVLKILSSFENLKCRCTTATKYFVKKLTIYIFFLHFSIQREQFQLKSTSIVDEYEFKCCDETKKFVKNEFRETDELRNQTIHELREWVVKNPRIQKMRLDSKFLLRFLRAKKFSVPMAKELIERYLVLRFFIQDDRELFRSLDVDLEPVQELLNLG